jgi:hypothetical protein
MINETETAETVTNLADSLIAFEMGQLENDEIIALFQELINTELAWSLQGSYGRMANTLIEEGLCHA